MATISFPLALYLRLGDEFPLIMNSEIAVANAGFSITAVSAFIFSKMYRGIWRYASINDLLTITKAVTFAILIFFSILFVLTRLEGIPRSAPLIQWFILMALLGGPRFCYRSIKDRHLGNIVGKISHRRVSVLLIGAGDNAETFIREQARDPNSVYHIIGVIDQDNGRVGREIHGVPIIAELTGLDKVLREYSNVGLQRIILTNRDLAGETVREMLGIAEQHGITMARLPLLTELKTDLENTAETRPIDITDLLGRPQAVLDRDAIKKLVAGKKILITGAGGTIGKELVRQISDHNPAHITLLDNAEYNLYQIDMELSNRHKELSRKAVLGSVRDRKRMENLISQLKPELVFHAAALKHVPMVEANPLEGILTNTIGSQIVADACQQAKVAVMVQISTDKAVNPTNVMGATKRLAECYCQSLDVAERPSDGTRYVTVRFGNVLGSTGSVVPLFQNQLAKGGPLTVTHKDITRYFMTKGEAVELVLQASAKGSEDSEAGGKIFVLDMGAPVKIYDLAEQIIRLSGQKPGKDVKIDIIGLRPGEKLHEELLHVSEDLVPTQSPGLFLAAPKVRDLNYLKENFMIMITSAQAGNLSVTLRHLAELVPEYKPFAKK
ncbi:MAG: nucleoside-diphosphate sugar epimerase/dehydratase [Pseudomonadota bacterium]|nr:nucleoside-diphosphate sugar epimerase/dehydratase [Pseudomonadota bacterium]